MYVLIILILTKTFFDGGFCNNITDEENCDIVQSCFWEGNKCFHNSLVK